MDDVQHLIINYVERKKTNTNITMITKNLKTNTKFNDLINLLFNLNNKIKNT